MYSYYHSQNGQTTPENGNILVAEPFLTEEYFSRSCILLTNIKAGGAIDGFVLNKPTKFHLGQIIRERLLAKEEIPVFCGGPLSMDRLFYIHNITTIPDSIPIGNGLLLNGDWECIIDYLNSGADVSNHIKFFIGYSGWDRGQLCEELQEITWAVLPCCSQEFILANNTQNQWEKAVRDLGDDYSNWLICPIEPSLN